MNLEQLKIDVFEANLRLPELGLVTFTWGNASGIDRERGLVAIKPSGVEYDDLTPDALPVLRLEDGEQVEGDLRPSSDAPSHLALYRAFADIGGVVHTHSRWATIFAQTRSAIPPLGTTHADHFYGEVPCTRALTDAEIGGDYEAETGKVIAETIGLSTPDSRAVLVASHGPFAWGKDAMSAVISAAVLEEVAFMAWHTLAIDPDTPPIGRELMDKHYLRKHGDAAYYGQGR
ncbi:MAG: L-ribulose-5-phosphate 4-epimerase [Clostridiales Family XIII bacterium]|jgi:L-ribulose-5-phosphate 4-epimerase|nr:L-ribulose-5-phosphate 4-epimerase [Clostridiales Family XIII bacterium]